MGNGGGTWVRAALSALAVLLLVGPAAAQTNIGAAPAPGGSGAGLYANSWAVVIGINDYAHPRVPRLRYAVNDARAIEAALLGQGFRRDRIVTLLDAQATKSRIETVLGDDLRQKVGANDRVFVFFAGHGKTDRLRSGEDEGFLIPVDGDPSRLFGSAISMTALRQISDRLPAKHILYVVDACYSGYALFNRAISDDLLEEMVRRPAIQILTAGRQGDQAQERGGHGVFTEVLLHGLQGDAFTSKGWLALEELGLWVKQRVFAESNKKQLPQYGNLSGEGQFVFVRAGARGDAAPTPSSRTPPALPAPSSVAPPAPAGAGAPPVAPPPQVATIPRGGVSIESTPPGATVYLDARPIGKTPLTLPSVDPGRHQLVMVLDGYATLVEDVDVVAGRPLRLAKTLAEQAGALEVLTKPAGVKIEVDGVPMGTSPQKLPRLRVGKHKVAVSHDDYQRVERDVTIDYEQLAKLEIELPPRPARLVITSSPGQAEFWVANRKLGLTVWAGELPPGKHLLRVAKDGYEDKLFDLLLGPNEAKSLDAALKKWDLGEMVLIPAGEFWMGSDENADEKPRRRVHLDAYYIDKYEVTNAQFKAFADARGYGRQELWSPDGWRWRSGNSITQPSSWTHGKWNEPKQPVVSVSWYEAEAFCRFGGKRLPTEAEWEKAARGTDGRKYPWGEQWDASRANSSESKLGKPAVVGSYPGGVSPYGAHDMAGNAWEWVADWYAADYYQQSPERNPTGPASGQSRVLRGGSWHYDPILLRSAARGLVTPVNRYSSIGFRCGRGL
jgi:formylglycine-generating enzyme required for sulfatase activity